MDLYLQQTVFLEHFDYRLVRGQSLFKSSEFCTTFFKNSLLGSGSGNIILSNWNILSA